MGKYNGLKGPGPFMIIPVIDSVPTYIDQRVRVSAFKAEQTLTKDTVPVNVDAVVYWTVWDVEKAALEVQEYQKAIEHITQTGLRDTIGKHELSDLLQERDKIAEDLQQVLDRNTNPWGITCQTVGIKDIAIPQDLAEAMSKEAQAERERRARVILGTAETEIAEKFEQASKKYTDNPVALHLRGMNMLFEGLKEKGSMVIVPSSALDTMNLGGPAIVIATSVPVSGDPRSTSVYAYNRFGDRYWKVTCPYLPAHYPGTGDTFTSVITGALMQGDSLPIALDRATQFILQGIRATFGYEYNNLEGIMLEKVLHNLDMPIQISSYELVE